MSPAKQLTVRDGLAVLPKLRTDPLGFFAEVTARHGDFVESPSVRAARVFLVTKPDYVAQVLVGNQANYRKADTYRPLSEVLGNGLLTNEGDSWARQRRLVQPMFARRHINGFAPDMTAAAGRMLGQWASLPDGATIDASAQLNALTLDVVGRALFSTDLTGDAAAMGPALAQLLETFSKIVRSPLFWLIPSYYKWRTPARIRADRATATLNRVLDGIISGRRATGGDHADLLGMLLAARDEDTGTGMSEQQVRDELMTFLLAGHETTSNALAWALSLLSTHPDVRDRVESEVDGVLAGRPPTEADADKLEYTAAVINEAMRLYPPAWTLEREAIEADEIGGTPIPAGSVLITPPYLIHRHPDHWPNPEGFDPGRFLPDAARGRHKLAFLPFGAGRRQCVGGGFAMLEATLLLATIVQSYRLDLAPGTRPVPLPSVTLRLADGLPMRVFRR